MMQRVLNSVEKNSLALNCSSLSVACRRSYAVDQKPQTGVLFLNLGGPETQEDVHDFLLRLFSDKDLIPLPFQKHLSKFIAKRRTPSIQEQYKEIGGGSPIKKWTSLQNELLCKELDISSPETAPHVPYIAFRYTRPLTEDALAQIKKDGVKRVVCYSQYPQYSCSTTGSSLNELHKQLKGTDLEKDVEWSTIDRWPTSPLFIEAVGETIKEKLSTYPEEERDSVILMFSAHSLPMSVVGRGDPYPGEVAASVHHVMEKLNIKNPYRLVWQSKVGPSQWLTPGTGDSLKGYAEKGVKNIIMIPIAFTSDHIETLFELDLEYGAEAREMGVTGLTRSESMNDRPLFIKALSEVFHKHVKNNFEPSPQLKLRCPMCVNPKCGPTKQFFAPQSEGYFSQKEI